jgi:hypothetical protein
MLAVLGALFTIGTALSFFQASRVCGKVDLYASPRYGALWAVIPAIAYTITGNAFIMIVATWIPTILLVLLTEYTICKNVATLKESGVRK